MAHRRVGERAEGRDAETGVLATAREIHVLDGFASSVDETLEFQRYEIDQIMVSGPLTVEGPLEHDTSDVSAPLSDS